MVRGMTGFGSAQFSAHEIRGQLEIKSLNHRYLDIAYYLPPGFASVENKIQQVIQKHLERGRVTVAVKITRRPQQSLYLNETVAKQYLKYAQTLKKDFGLTDRLGIMDLMRMPGVVDIKETVLDIDSLWSSIEKALSQALKSLSLMRAREGKSLTVDIQDQLKRMRLQIKQIQSRAKAILQEKRSQMTAEEFSSFQKGNDVNEEIARLTHFIDEFKAVLKSSVAIGKKLDFIAQEMQRETNTIGSKLQDKVVANAVIALKSKIEKIREQSQNIE